MKNFKNLKNQVTPWSSIKPKVYIRIVFEYKIWNVCKKIDLNISKIGRLRAILCQKIPFLNFFWKFWMADNSDNNSSIFESFCNFFSRCDLIMWTSLLLLTPLYYPSANCISLELKLEVMKIPNITYLIFVLCILACSFIQFKKRIQRYDTV